MKNQLFIAFLTGLLLAGSGCTADKLQTDRMLISVDNAIFYPGTWSEDSSLIYATFNRGNSWQVAQISATTGEYKLINVGLVGVGVADSKGSRLLLESVEDNGSDIYTYDLGTQTLKRITETERYEWHPAFAPDGDSITYDVSTEYGPDIYQQNLNSSETLQLTDSSGSEQAAQYSTDGKYIAFHRHIKGNNYDMFVLDLDTMHETPVATSMHEESYPNWHPGGDHIVFSSNRNGSFDLFIACINEDIIIPLIEGPTNDKYPKWSPDGQSVLYQSDRNKRNALYIISAPDLPNCQLN